MATVIPLLLAALAISRGEARACDCRRLPEVSPAVRNEAAVIFVGRVVETVERSEHVSTLREDGAEGSVKPLENFAVFKVERAWNGVHEERASVQTDGSDCEFVFKPGSVYLVFADPGPDGRPYTSICLRTKPVSDAAAILDALGEASYVPPARKAP
jgi:hypothetical protein